MSRRITRAQMKICDVCEHHFKRKTIYCCNKARCCGKRVKGKCEQGKF